MKEPRAVIGEVASWLIVIGNLPTCLLGISYVALGLGVFQKHDESLGVTALLSAMFGPTLSLGTLLLAIPIYLFAKLTSAALWRINLSLAAAGVIIGVIYLMGK